MKQRERGVDAEVAGGSRDKSPTEAMPSDDSDDSVLREVCQRVLAADPALVSCSIRLSDHEEAARRQVLATEGVEGRIHVHVEAAIVILEGEVPSLGHKRLAGVLAHRLPGCRGVANRLGVALEEDSDEELGRTLRLVFSRNPVLARTAIRVRVDGAVVVLEGTVASAREARLAARDAANVFGVVRVEDRLSIDPALGHRTERLESSASDLEADERGNA